MITPNELHAALPCSVKTKHVIMHARQSVVNILQKKENRLLVIVGPCSLHHRQSALDYAQKLQRKIEQHRDTLCIIMRAYVEKSRTSTGWRGLINDPDLNNTYLLEKGLYQARSLLLALNELNVPVAAEIVSPLTAPYFVDLLSFAAIGAHSWHGIGIKNNE